MIHSFLWKINRGRSLSVKLKNEQTRSMTIVCNEQVTFVERRDSSLVLREEKKRSDEERKVPLDPLTYMSMSVQTNNHLHIVTRNIEFGFFIIIEETTPSLQLFTLLFFVFELQCLFISIPIQKTQRFHLVQDDLFRQVQLTMVMESILHCIQNMRRKYTYVCFDQAMMNHDNQQNMLELISKVNTKFNQTLSFSYR